MVTKEIVKALTPILYKHAKEIGLPVVLVALVETLIWMGALTVGVSEMRS